VIEFVMSSFISAFRQFAGVSTPALALGRRLVDGCFDRGVRITRDIVSRGDFVSGRSPGDRGRSRPSWARARDSIDPDDTLITAGCDLRDLPLVGRGKCPDAERLQVAGVDAVGIGPVFNPRRSPAAPSLRKNTCEKAVPHPLWGGVALSAISSMQQINEN